MMPAIAVIAAYLIGGIPFGYLLVKLRTGQDVREAGSGNIGATNVLRTSGKLLGVATLLLDIAKGSLAVLLADWLSKGDVTWMTAAAVAVVAGHAFPPMLRFQGGKAVASFIGAFLYLTPAALVAVLVVFVVTVAVTRYISAGSVLAAGLFPLAVWMILHPPPVVTAAALLCGWFIVWRHKGNLERLRAGTENVFRFGGSR